MQISHESKQSTPFRLYLNENQRPPCHTEQKSVACSEISKSFVDENIANIDINALKIKTLPKHKARIDEFFAPYKHYKCIVGVNPFGNTAYKFAPQDFAILAKNLAQKYPNVLFIVMSFSANLICFKPFDEPNIAIWENDDEIMNLVELTSRLNLLISPDTGNVHIADIFEVPILQTMKANLALKWGGGSFHKYFVIAIIHQKQSVVNKAHSTI